jgi:Antitoxin Phd_YefM, type II toxin-antitoxin system
MTSVTIDEAKTQLAKLIEQVERGEEVIITRDNNLSRASSPTFSSCPSAASVRCGARPGSTRAFGSPCPRRN